MQWMFEGIFSSNFIRNIAYNKDSKIGYGNKEIIGYMIKVYRYLSLGLFLVTVLFGVFFLKRQITSSSSPNLGFVVLGVYSLLSPIIIYGGIFSNQLQGYHLISKVKLAESIFNICTIFSNIFLLILFRNIYLLIINNLFWQLISVLYNRRLVRILISVNLENGQNPLLENNQKQNSFVIRDDIKKTFIGSIFSQGIYTISIFVFSKLLEPDILATYLFAFNLIQNVRGFALVPFYSNLPMMATLAKGDNIQVLLKFAQRKMLIVYLVFTLLFLFFMILIKLSVFDGHTKIQLPNSQLWYLLGLAFFLERFGAMHLQLYTMSGDVIWHKANGLGGVLILLVWFLTFRFLNERSFPVALIVTYSTVYSYLSVLPSYKYLGTNFWKFEKYTFLPFLIIFILLSFFTI
jgi:hypothetical protein